MNYDKFDGPEEAWFWFITANEYRNSGAKVRGGSGNFRGGSGNFRRPCEPVDILKVVDRLYRKRRLTMDHILVLRHYGVRQERPDDRRPREARAHKLWEEAMERIGGVLRSKGVVYEEEGLSWLK